MGKIMHKLKVLILNFLLNTKKIILRFNIRNQFKANTKCKKINYKSFWKKYDKKYSSIFHNFYFEKTGINSKFFIPDDFFYSEIDMRLNDWDGASFLDDKNLYKKYFPNIKQPKTIASKINGDWYINDNIATLQQIEDLVKSKSECVCKVSKNSCGGSGVKFINKDKLMDFNNLGDNLILQEVIKQSKELSKLSNTSLNTVRVMTILLDGKASALSSIVRFGINGSKVDNASSGGLTCGIASDGTLRNFAFKSNGDKYLKNPNNDIPFNTIKIPNFDNLINLCIKSHISFPYFKLISWDFAYDENDEPILIECNLCYGELDFHQLNNGPIFGDKTEKYLDKILSK